MHLDNYFSLSNSSINEAEFVLLGIPYDRSQSFKSGSRFAPAAIREASWNFEEYSFLHKYDLSRVKVCDVGNINCDGSFFDIQKRVSKLISRLHAIPIAIGGEHSISYLVAKEFCDACYLVFDAHFDLRDEFDGDKFSHACITRRIFEEGIDVIIVGVRSGSREEIKFAKENEIHFFSPWDLSISRIVSLLDEYDKVYVSLDFDVFDPSYAPSVSTPEPFGISPIDFIKLLDKIPSEIVGFDLVEVIPDDLKVTQSLAAKLIFEFIASVKSRA